MLDPLAPLLRRMAAAGYAGFEGPVLAGMDALGPDAGGSGMRCAGIGAVTGQLLDGGDAVIADCRRVGAERVLCSGPVRWHDRTLADWLETVRVLNAAGRRMKEVGIKLLYHNHDFEFVRLPDGRLPMEVLMDGLARGDCDLCLDAGWVWFAGVDVVAVMQAYGARIRTLHVRDFAGRTSCALGEGRVPVAEILSAVPSTVEWMVVEQDPVSADPAGDMEISMGWLKSVLG
jgi:sugar phosphate isomerase/epimerase